MHHPGAGHLLKQLAGKMLRSADAGRAERDLVRIRLEIGDQFRHGARLDLVGVDDENVWYDADLGNRRQILVRLVTELRSVESGVDCERGRAGKPERDA